MAKRKSTIRKMVGMPESREFYRTLAQIQGLVKRLERQGERIESLELAAAALKTRARIAEMRESLFPEDKTE